MKRLVTLTALLLAACAARELSTGTSAQRVSPTRVGIQSRARAVARALCGVPPGCFAYPPECATHTCFCPKVCVSTGRSWNTQGRIWRPDVAECACEATP